MAATVNELLAKIEQCSEQNRAQRSAVRELELVELRHATAQALLGAPKGQAAKTRADDLFVNCKGLPEIQGAELNADTLAAGYTHSFDLERWSSGNR